MADYKNVEEFLQDAMNTADQLNPADRKAFLSALFQQKIASSKWFSTAFENDPAKKKEFAAVFGGTPEMYTRYEPALQTWQPKSFAERVWERSGGVKDPRDVRGPADVVETGLSFLNPTTLPFRALGEGIDTAGDYLTGRNQRPQPTATGPGSVLPQTLGGWTEQGLMAIPAAWRAAWRIPGMLPRLLKMVETNIEANRAAAATENVGAVSRPKMRYGPSGLTPSE